jgi:hypothetical protein
MKYARGMLAGFYILISVFSFFSLVGCIRGVYREEYRGDRHYYRDGRWYKHDSRGNEVAVADLVIGAIAESLPPQHTTVVIQGNSYYHDGNHYYKQAPSGGYMVVAPPVIAQPQSQSNDNGHGERGDKQNEGNRDQNH